MTTYARIVNGTVAEPPITLPEGKGPFDCFHSDIARTFIPVPEGATVIEGMTWTGAVFGDALGGVIAPAVPVPDITAAQARLYLLGIGKSSADVEAAIGTLPSPDKERALILWEYETVYRRASPMWDLLGPTLGIADMDAAFRAAAAL